MFLGRHHELSQLQHLYDLQNFQLFILYGWRRVGKTSLLKEFCKDKDNIFFYAELSSKTILKNFPRLFLSITAIAGQSLLSHGIARCNI